MRRRLDAELVRRRLVPSRGRAQEAISAGRVYIDGVVQPKASTLVGPDTPIHVLGEPPRFVSRAGHKLEAALTTFPMAVAGRRAFDVGASTGGFTDCLLQHGAASVVALDVGYGQIDWKLRSDERVTVVERTNIRHADLGSIGAPFDVVVADLSFISLLTVAPALVAAGAEDGDYVLLVKPQFEVGKGEVGKGGIVRDATLRAETLVDVAAGLSECGLGTFAAVASPLTGAKGNQEYLLWCRREPRQVPAAELRTVAGP